MSDEHDDDGGSGTKTGGFAASIKDAGQRAMDRLSGLDFKDVAPDDADAPNPDEYMADEDGASETTATPASEEEKTTEAKASEPKSDTPQKAEDTDGDEASASRLREIEEEIARYEKEVEAATESSHTPPQRQEAAVVPPAPAPPLSAAQLPPLPEVDLDMMTPAERQQYEFLKSLRDREVARDQELARLREWKQEQEFQANVTKLREATEKAMSRHPDVFGEGASHAKLARKAVLNDIVSSAEPVHLVVARVAREVLAERKQALTKTVTKALDRKENRTGGTGGTRASAPTGKKSFTSKDLESGKVRDRVSRRLQEASFEDM